MYRYPFAVADTVFCCWEHDLPERNERFLKGIDAEYFECVAQLHGGQLDGGDSQRAAMALRATYHHGIETLFSFLGALAQAPDAVLAWIPKCSTPALREVVESFTRGASILTQRGRQTVSIADLSAAVHQYCWPEDVPQHATRDRYTRFWQRLASEFLNEHNAAEYNSLKHGFRISPGGFILRIGEEEQYGVRAPDENMRTVGGSPYGTSFYEPLPVLEDSAAKHHFRVRHAAHNWRAEAMVLRLQLIAWSINNVVGALRCMNGAPPGTIRFLRPEDAAAFDDAWRWSVGVTRSNMDLEITGADIAPVSRAELLQELEGRAGAGAG